jgi:CheY-like chemotaxis protein
VYEAADGITAVAPTLQCPDLIILDLGLPGPDSWTVARELRVDPALDHVPILVITANSSSAAQRLARAAGCQAMICKPFGLETVEEEERPHSRLGYQTPLEFKQAWYKTQANGQDSHIST